MLNPSSLRPNQHLETREDRRDLAVIQRHQFEDQAPFIRSMTPPKQATPSGLKTP